MENVKQLDKDINTLWFKVVDEVNKYMEGHPEGRELPNELEELADNFFYYGAWIYDRVKYGENHYARKHSKQAMSYKIRKAVGYTYP